MKKTTHTSLQLIESMVKHVSNDYKSISFSVRAEPRTKGSMKLMPLGKRKIVVDKSGRGHEVARRHVMLHDKSKQLVYWVKQIQVSAKAAMQSRAISNLDQPVVVLLQFILDRPKSHYGTGRNEGKLRQSAPKHQSVKPDVDKLSRAVLDALEGICFINDSRVKTLIADKEYVTTGSGVNGLMATIVYLDELREPARDQHESNK